MKFSIQISKIEKIFDYQMKDRSETSKESYQLFETEKKTVLLRC